MFRPVPEPTWCQLVPVRLIASVLVILAVAVSVLLLFSLEHEKFVVHGLTEGKAIPTGLFPALWQSRRDLIAIAILLFLVSAVGIAAVITFLHYGNTRRTLEEVKGLARNILERIPTGILTVNQHGLITAVNPTAEGIVGRPADRLLGHTYEEAFPEGDAIRTVLEAALRGHHHVQHQDLPYEGTNGVPRMIRVSSVELTGDQGTPTGVILQAQDVTDWLALERRVRVAEKLAALHTLSAGVAHELRNPLSALDLNLHLLEEELASQGQLSPRTSAYLDVLSAETRRLTGILDNFLKFARPGTIRLERVDVRALVAHVASLLQYEAKEHGVELQIAPGGDPAAVLGDDTQISQVLVNIVVNALHAMPHGGTCTITVRGRPAGGRDWVEIVVRDTGVGIKPEELARLFEPFYTTKATGTGLGLAIAYRIVHDHGGTIEVESQPGAGTTVVVRLPACVAAPVEAVNP